MSVTFSSKDLARLECLSATLLSPLDAPSIDAWRRDACLQLRELVGADKVYFLGEGFPDGDVLWCDGFPDPLAAAYRAVFRQEEGVKRAIRFGYTAFNQELIVAGDWDGYHRDPTVNELYRPFDVNDVLGLVSELESPAIDGPRALRFQLGATHPTYGTEEFGDKGLQMLRLLAPSFEAGVGALLATAEWRVALGSALDALDAAGWVFRLDGRVVLHRNAAASRLVRDDRQGATIERHAISMAARLSRVARPVKSGGGAGGAMPAAVRVRTEDGMYSVKGSYVGAAQLGTGRSILVVVTRLSAHPVAWPALQREHRLTARELDVARLVYAALRSAEIARQLGTSEHTVRHHIERLYAKLGVHTRGEAQRLIREYHNGRDD